MFFERIGDFSIKQIQKGLQFQSFDAHNSSIPDLLI